MALLPPPEEPDCWKLVGVDDASTPPTVARVLDTAGSRPEWRQAGFPVLFDSEGRVRHVQRAGRIYRFELVDVDAAARMRHPPPLAR
jgi:hypothetical protein